MKTLRLGVMLLVALATPASASGEGDSRSETPQAQPPNVLLVVFDDLNDWSEAHPALRRATPNLQTFAKSSANFSQASTASPVCNPSRVALLTGVHPTRSGVYNNAQVFPRLDHWIREAATLPRYFRDNGYTAAGYGKIFHHRHPEAYAAADFWSEGREAAWSLEREEMLPEAAELRMEIPALKRHFGRLPDDWDRDDPEKMQQDTLNTMRASAFLKEKHDKPFFLALGIYRPHTHWYAARRYWDMFPRETIKPAPGINENDLDDVPPYGRMLAYADAGPKHPPEAYADLDSLPLFPERAPYMRVLNQQYLIDHDLYKDAQRAYLASAAYADDLFGRIMRSLEESGYADNTVVIVLSDHGYHLGEKEHWHKSTLWERSMRVPFMIRDPRLKNGARRIASPVSLLDIYPTLVELSGLSRPRHDLDGVSLVPLLSGEAKNRGRPVLSTYHRGFHSVRDDQYRFIRYPDGSRELYNLGDDPWEWRNLAPEARHRAKIEELEAYIPTEEEQTAGHLSDQSAN